MRASERRDRILYAPTGTSTPQYCGHFANAPKANRELLNTLTVEHYGSEVVAIAGFGR